MSFESSRPLPSQRKLLQATAVAIVVAGIVLVSTVLPAEYGIDPTGLGDRLGLTALAAEQDEATPSAPALAAPASVALPAPPATASEAVGRRDTAPFADSQTVTLPPGKGVEIKARMKAGDQFVFHWVASDAVGFDMHGERPDAAEGEYTSYWIEQAQSTASGTFTAPFDGSHGWYWHNKGGEPVTVTVAVSGYFEGKLYRP